MDISVIAARKRGEKRNGNFSFNSKGNLKNWNNDFQMNPCPTMMDHRKHEGLIYRKANGGIENTFSRISGILCT